MPWYGWDDDFYDSDAPERPTDMILIDGPVRATSRRGPIGVTRWGRGWVEVIESGGGNRLSRGKTYARNGSVLSLALVQGEVSAEVQGSQRRPYETSIEVKILAEKEWERVLDALSERGLHSAKLLGGEMPADIEAVFEGEGLSLFPASRGDIAFTCTCPDWGDPCKHAAAVYYLIADQLDDDPFLLFHLKGMPRERFLAGLRERIGLQPAVEAAPLEADPSTFWGQPLEPLLARQPQIPQTPPPLDERLPLRLPVRKDLKRLYVEVSAWALGDLASHEHAARDSDAPAE